MVINGGAASTTSRTVTLTSASADAETGIEGVQVSVDGVIDTEPVQPFAATRIVTLPAGSGTKTVLVRYHNRAGMIADCQRHDHPGQRRRPAGQLVVEPAEHEGRWRHLRRHRHLGQRGQRDVAGVDHEVPALEGRHEGSGDVLLRGTRAVPQLGAGATSRGRSP